MATQATEDDITVTIREEHVIEKIKAFIAKHRLHPQLINNIYRIVVEFALRGLSIDSRTQIPLFDEKLVDEAFNLVDLNKCPKDPNPIQEETINQPESLNENTSEIINEIDPPD